MENKIKLRMRLEKRYKTYKPGSKLPKANRKIGTKRTTQIVIPG